MSGPLNVVVPMAGRGSRFAERGIDTPKPLIDVRGKPMYAWAVDGLPLSRVARLVFICLREHLEHRALADDIARRYGRFDPAVLSLDAVTEGQACTVLAAREMIDNERPLVIYNADTYCPTTLAGALDRMGPVDGVLDVFRASGDKWSFARADGEGRVLETAEKRRISEWASTGLYYFGRGQDFVRHAGAMIAADERSNREFYVAPVYNRMIAAGMDVRINPVDEVWSLGTPEDLERFLGRTRIELATMDQPIRFSICVPNYNYGRYLGQTLRSVLEQDYPHFEIIVADNASTDDSVAVVETCADPRVRLIRNRYNIGFAPNLDRATADARHEFMILLSSDDLMRPGALAAYAKVLHERGADAQRTVLTSAVDVIDSAGQLTGVAWRPRGAVFYESMSREQAENTDWTTLEPEAHSGLALLRESLRQKDVPAFFLATCYSRKLYDAVEGYHSTYRFFPDAHYLQKLLAEDPQVVYVPQRLFAYRVHNQNQLAVEAHAGALKYQVDGYMHAVEFPPSVLAAVGLSRDDLARVFIERGVIDPGLTALAAGAWQKAFKCLAFGMASFPGHTLRQWKTYPLAGLLALGPLGKLVARGLYRRTLARRDSHA